MPSSEVTAALLRRLPIFAATAQQALAAVARVCLLRRVARNAHVVRAGGQPIAPEETREGRASVTWRFAASRR